MPNVWYYIGWIVIIAWTIICIWFFKHPGYLGYIVRRCRCFGFHDWEIETDLTWGMIPLYGHHQCKRCGYSKRYV